MKAFLELRNMRIENANASAGLTHGFPAITSFLGFTHALSRKLCQENPILRLEGCAVIVHHHQIHAMQPNSWRDAVWCLTRNPLTKEGETPSFNQEGRMHLTVSLLMECNFDDGNLPCRRELFEDQVKEKALTQRLAGGMIVDIEEISLKKPPEDSQEQLHFLSAQKRRWAPGFILVERGDLLVEHWAHLRASRSEAELLEAWLDFVSVQHKAKRKKDQDGQESVGWEFIPKPSAGWLVPLHAGYRAISEAYAPGQVKNVRDVETPFRFVESAYTIGQWLNPYNIQNLKQIFWRYHADQAAGWYLCKNDYLPSEDDRDIDDSSQSGE